jgi:O-antigen ligase
MLFGWIPVVLALSAMMPTRRAVVAAFVIAWSFLPMYSYHIPGIPAYNKMSATCCGVLLAALLLDIGRLFAFRPSWMDIPMAVWCLCPIASSLSNGLGWYDGISTAFTQTVAWGVPYFIGRLYLGDLRGLRELAVGIFAGGVAYVPLCLFEIRMSPQLHRILYGYHANDFQQTMRFGGWRPTVFMEHGLMVGMWMSMAAMIGLWLWWTGALKRLWGFPIGALAMAVLVTAILCKSLGALVLLAVGLVALASIKVFHTRLVIVILILIAPAYVFFRTTHLWNGHQLQSITDFVSYDRSQSLNFRFFNEDLLSDKAMQRPWFGWGGWGRALIYNTQQNWNAVVDGEWINALGMNGLVGLTSFMLILLLPPIRMLWRMRIDAWSSLPIAAATALLVVNLLYMIDCIPNGMTNPIYMLAVGGLTGILTFKPQPAARRHPAPQVSGIGSLVTAPATGPVLQ